MGPNRTSLFISNEHSEMAKYEVFRGWIRMHTWNSVLEYLLGPLVSYNCNGDSTAAILESN